MQRIVFLSLGILILSALSINVHAQRQYGGFYTREKINNLQNNTQNHDWARELKDITIKKAEPWVSKSDEYPY
jgi:hypothetical protein